MINEVYGIFAGRFQPFHLGHLQCINYILKKVTNKLVVAVIVIKPEGFEQPSSSLKKSSQVNEVFSETRNPFSFWERYWMIRNSVDKEDRSVKNLHIIPIPRLDLEWSQVDEILPPKRFWILTGSTNRMEFEFQKANFFMKYNEKIEFIDFPTINISSTEIREAMLTGKEWRDFVPKTVAKILDDIKSVDRIKKLQNNRDRK